MSVSNVNYQRVMAALKDVLDPEFPISIVDMGLVYGIEEWGNGIKVQMSYTSTGCGCMRWIEDDIREKLMELPGVDEVCIDTVWDPVWTKDRLSKEAIETFRRLGMGV